MRSLLAPLVLLALLLGALGLAAWSPWDAETRERELEWLEAYGAWAEAPSGCASLGGIAPPPTARLERVARIAREACTERRDPRWDVRSVLIDSRSRDAPTTDEPVLARAAEPIAGRRVRVHCWPAEDWEPLAEDLHVAERDEFWVVGFADPARDRIDLAPAVCDPLRRFFETPYAPYLNRQSLELAEALAVLAHEAEHLRDPEAAEAVVECRAVQRVRGLALAEGRSRGYAGELAALAWEISYPGNPPGYRTRRCRDGGPLDEHPDSPVWP